VRLGRVNATWEGGETLTLQRQLADERRVVTGADGHITTTGHGVPVSAHENPLNEKFDASMTITAQLRSHPFTSEATTATTLNRPNKAEHDCNPGGLPRSSGDVNSREVRDGVDVDDGRRLSRLRSSSPRFKA
jgi:hypothetical protein